MASSGVSWGIEIGAGGIKAIQLESSGSGLNVLDFAVIPHKKPLSSPDTNPDDVLRVTLGQLMSQVDLSGSTVAVSVPGHSAFARFAKLPPVEAKKVPDIVKFEAVQQIPFPIEEVEWDYQTFVSPDSPDIEVGIFAIKSSWIRERLALYADVSLVPDIVTLSPVAAYNAMAYDLGFTEQTPGTIVLDIGTTSTDLIVAEAGRVWIRTFPIGGHHFTEALVGAFKLTYPKAEKLKREAEESKHARHVFQAMRPVFSDLTQDVQRSIGYYQSLHKDANLQRLIGVGSTFKLPGLRKYLKQQLGMNVYRVEQFKRLAMEGARSAELQDESVALMTAYGLALQGLGLSALNANLMPGGTIREAMWRRKVKWFGVAAGVAAAAGVSMFIRPFLDAQAVAAAPRDPVIDNVISDLKNLKAKAMEMGVTGGGQRDLTPANLVALLNDRDIYAHMMADLREMFAHANAKGDRSAATVLPGEPALVLESYATEYLRPVVEAADPFGGGGDTFMPPSSGRGGISGGDFGSPTPMGGGSSRGGISKHTDKPRILVSAVVTTTQPDASRFMISTVEEWLRKSGKRAGVPYEIVISREPWESIGTQVGSRGGEGSPSSVPTDGRSGRASATGDLLEHLRAPGEEVQVTGGSGATSFRGQGGPAARAREADLEKLAPLPGAPPMPEGLKRERFRVTWEVVLKTDAGQGGGQ